MIRKIILWIFCIFWAIMIFMFSNEPATISNETSLGFSEKVIMFFIKADIIDIPASSDGLEATVAQIAEQINNVMRKLAHFGIYHAFGVAVLMLTRCYFTSKKSFLISLAICLLYAVSDEVHQLFVPGRAGRIVDAFIDFSGALTGNLTYLLMTKIKNIRGNKV